MHPLPHYSTHLSVLAMELNFLQLLFNRFVIFSKSLATFIPHEVQCSCKSESESNLGKTLMIENCQFASQPSAGMSDMGSLVY